MHPNLYMSLECRRHTKWSFFIRLPDLGCDWVLFTLLGHEVENSEIDLQDCHGVRGFPPDVADTSISEDAYTIDDESSESDIGDILDDVRFCSEQESKSWVDSGVSRFINEGYQVTDPECYGQSWASYEEFANIVANAKKNESHLIQFLRAFLAAMTSLQEDGYTTRVIYWFGA